MSDFEILKELIVDEALVTIEDGLYGKQKVKLVEPKSRCHPEYAVNINNIPKDSIVIKTDAFPAPEFIFNDSKGECRRADFVIIPKMDVRQLIIFVELKKGKGKTAKIIQQLKGAQCVVEYFRSVVNVFWNQADFLNAKQYNYRFVSIHHIGANKKPRSEEHTSELQSH